MNGTITYYYSGLKFLPKMHRGNNFIQFNFKTFWYISTQHRESLLKFSFKYQKKNENMVVKSVKNSFIVAMAIFNNEGYIASNYDMANHCGIWAISWSHFMDTLPYIVIIRDALSVFNLYKCNKIFIGKHSLDVLNYGRIHLMTV